MEQRKNFNAAAQFGETLIRKHKHQGYMLCGQDDEHEDKRCRVEITDRSFLHLDELQSLVHICDMHGVESYILRAESSFRVVFV